MDELKIRKPMLTNRVNFALTVLLAANESGKEKFPSLIIERSKKRRRFATLKSFLMLCSSNTKAWMTSAIFAN